eukprot:2851395-Rhodomonas_salina.1
MSESSNRSKVPWRHETKRKNAGKTCASGKMVQMTCNEASYHRFVVMSLSDISTALRVKIVKTTLKRHVTRAKTTISSRPVYSAYT